MPTERKMQIVADLADKMSRVQLALVTDYRGMTMAELSGLRQKLRQNGVDIIVAKNTLLRLAARAAGREAIEPLLNGPTALAFVYDNISTVAKEFDDYLKTSKKMTLRGGLLGSSVIPPDGLKDVAKLPSRHVVLGQIAGNIQSSLSGLVSLLEAPARDLVNVVNAPVADLVNVLQARIDQLEQAS